MDSAYWVLAVVAVSLFALYVFYMLLQQLSDCRAELAGDGVLIKMMRERDADLVAENDHLHQENHRLLAELAEYKDAV